MSTNFPLAESVKKAQGWDNLLRALMLAGKQLPLLEEALRSDTTYLAGCESEVWMTVAIGQQTVSIHAFSPSKIIRGVLAVVIERVNGLHVNEAMAVDLMAYLDDVGLSRYLSQSRGNGMKTVVQVIEHTLREGYTESP